MKLSQVEHVLRAAKDITGDTQFIIIGSQSLHGKCPDIPDDILVSYEVDLYAKNKSMNTDLLNCIGEGSPFHEAYGYYADPVDENTAKLPKGWQGRLVNLKTTGLSAGAAGLCLDPHDLAIAKYFARREKDIEFNRAMVNHGIIEKSKLLNLIDGSGFADNDRMRITGYVECDFRPFASCKIKR